jgi:hypothetical protein
MCGEMDAKGADRGGGCHQRRNGNKACNPHKKIKTFYFKKIL